MRASLLFALLLCSGIVAAQGAPSPVQNTEVQDQKKARQEFQSFAYRLQSAWNRHDARGLAAMYTEDGRLVDPWGTVAQGRVEVERLLKEQHAGPLKSSVGTFRVERVRKLSPTLAFVDASVRFTGIRNPDGSAAGDMNIHGIFLVEKERNDWKILEARPYSYLPSAPQGVGGAGEEGSESPAVPPIPMPPPMPPQPSPTPPEPGPTY